MPDRPIRFGLFTPIATTYGKQAMPWTYEGGPDELRTIAAAADHLGFHHLTCSEHMAVPERNDASARYYHPLATFGFMAAITSRLRFLTHVVVLPYHHPIALAKQYGTLDRLSGGRLILGVGAGILPDEFDMLGLDFKRRGELYGDALLALRAALGQRTPSYSGAHFRFDGMVVDPAACQTPVPIWLGGYSFRSLRRALTHGDGWDPFGVSPARLREMLAVARTWPEWANRSSVLDIAVLPSETHDPRIPSHRAELVDCIADYRNAGATALNLSFRASSVDDYVQQLEAFQRDVAPRFA